MHMIRQRSVKTDSVMAFSALKPRSRIMRASPHQSDQQEKEAFNLLLQLDEADAEEAVPRRKSFDCEGQPPFKQLLSSSPSSLSSDPSSPIEQLPTFIAPQGLHSFQLPLKKECTKNWFTKHEYKSRHLVPLCEEQVFTQSFLDTSIPASNFHQNTHPRRCSMLHSKPKKPNLEHERHPKQKLQSYKKCGGTNNSIYGSALNQTMSIHEPAGVEKKRRSSASAREMISSKVDAAMQKNRFRDVQSSWEEEVRQAMAKSSLSKRQTDEACQGGAMGCGLQKHGTSALPPTLIVKRTDGHGNVDAAVGTEEAGVKLIHETVANGRTLPSKGAIDQEKRMWKGFNVVKSPSEERWEEAAQDEERLEMQRRARSQSMRYDTNVRTSDLTGIICPNGNVFHNDEEWAVYTRSGYISVRPRRSNAEASATCCSSLMGRSLSMRDTKMGLVMECAACGAALHGAGGRLLCFCSCCAATRASTMQGTPSSHKKKGGGGILRVCRRLLGLSKKGACNS